jgi:hypothetical protein
VGKKFKIFGLIGVLAFLIISSILFYQERSIKQATMVGRILNTVVHSGIILEKDQTQILFSAIQNNISTPNAKLEGRDTEIYNLRMEFINASNKTTVLTVYATPPRGNGTEAIKIGETKYKASEELIKLLNEFREKNSNLEFTEVSPV